MDITGVKKIHVTPDHHQANMLLRCGWILLEVRDGRFTLGQTEKFRCPACEAEIGFSGVRISSWEGLHIVDCPGCGEYKIPYGLTIDEFFVDGKTAYNDDPADR